MPPHGRQVAGPALPRSYPQAGLVLPLPLGPALLCFPDELRGPLSQVLQPGAGAALLTDGGVEGRVGHHLHACATSQQMSGGGVSSATLTPLVQAHLCPHHQG